MKIQAVLVLFRYVRIRQLILNAVIPKVCLLCVLLQIIRNSFDYQDLK